VDRINDPLLADPLSLGCAGTCTDLVRATPIDVVPEVKGNIDPANCPPWLTGDTVMGRTAKRAGIPAFVAEGLITDNPVDAISGKEVRDDH
jgi:hypothetical protein